MSSNFENWKKNRGVRARPDQAKSTSTPQVPIVAASPPIPSEEYPGLTVKAVQELNTDYVKRVAVMRGAYTTAPSNVSSARSGASTTSMMERLAKVEAALTISARSVQQQQEQLVKMNKMLTNQDRLIELLASQVIGEAVKPEDSVSNTGAPA
jgi:hypothetical protein